MIPERLSILFQLMIILRLNKMTLDELKTEVEKCDKCELCKTRTKTVFGSGDEKTDLLFVGEAPGKNEDETGIPFVGRAGQLLNVFFDAVGIDREKVYITNILKCRPPQNRDPLPSEEKECIDFLHKQIEIINPKMIVCLGRISAMKLIKEDFKITKEHGVMFEYNKLPICAVYHPSALLRDPSKREDMYKDLKKIKELYFKLTEND